MNSLVSISLIAFFTIITVTLKAQKPTIQDCLGAIPICTEVYVEKNAPIGSGNYRNEIFGANDGGISCMDDERNSIWYTFTVNKSGNFGFVLTPNDPSDDYDWALIDITNATCDDIYHNIDLQISCNAAGSDQGDDRCNGPTGADGRSSFSNQGGGCGADVPTALSGKTAHNALVPVLRNSTYVLLVSNWNSSKNGYEIDFGPSDDLGIFDNEPPEIQNLKKPKNCDTEGMLIDFTENIQISSISGRNFNLTGPDGDHRVMISSQAQDIEGEYDRSFKLSFDPKISKPGMYKLHWITNKMTEILDLCGNPLQNTPDVTFEISDTRLLPPDNIVDTILCAGTSSVLDVSDVKADSYRWSDSTAQPFLEVTESGAYSVTLSNQCGQIEVSTNVQFVNCNPCAVFVPNAITPNGDGINDRLQVFSDCVLQGFSLRIFNRWGNLIYKSYDQNVSWNGLSNDSDQQSTSVFIYLLQYEVQELGEVFSRTISGDIAVLR